MTLDFESMGGHEKFQAKLVKDNAKHISIRLQSLVKKLVAFQRPAGICS